MAGTQQGQAARTDEPSALVLLIDGLIERVQRSPLMRRAPAQCSPEEQIALAGTLADLVTLRALRGEVARLPHLPLEQVTAHWPELGGLLSVSRRAARPKAREGGQSGAATGGLFDAVPTSAEAETPEVEEREEPAAPATGPDLAHPILEALTVQGKALNTTQMLTWLHDRGIAATREEVMDALFRHEELFRRRGGSYWAVASQEAAD